MNTQPNPRFALPARQPSPRLILTLVTLAIQALAWKSAGGGVLPDGGALPVLPSPPSRNFVSTVPNWIAEPNQANADFGFSAATAGDVNGDGFSDVIVGAPFYDNDQIDEGRAFLYLGTALGLAATPSWTAESNQVEAAFGYSVAAAGDVNRDGFADVIIGAPYFDNGQEKEGRAFVYLGSAQGLASSPSWVAESNQPLSFFGTTVASAGDVNGDGLSDVVVAAVAYDNGEDNEGRLFVYRGSAQGVSGNPAFLEGNQAGCSFGTGVAPAGDVNADGYGDLIVGAWLYDNGQGDEGRAFLYLGSAYGLGSAPVWTAESNQGGAYFGESVAGAGDVNGDGFADVIIGASNFDNMQNREGKAVVYPGAAQGLGASPIWAVESNLAESAFGAYVGTAGDVNGDGQADVIVSAPDFTNGQAYEGKVFLYLSGNGLSTTPAWEVESNVAFGAATCVTTAGDVNGDGFSDLLVGSRSFANGELGEGRAAVYHGSPNIPSTQFFYSYSSFQTDAWFGVSVAAAGDIDANGYSDAIVGAPNYDGGETDEGRAYVLYGDDSGVVPLECNQAGAQMGSSVAGAGDVNGDGHADVIAGAPQFSNGQPSEGRAYLYIGSASGVITIPEWIAESNEASAKFGAAVASAGDVNGDGYGDVLVGAPEYSNGQSNEGRVYLYLGSASGLGSTPAWTAESNQASSGFGGALGTAGDVNGDGFSDVIVGANLYDNGQSNEGRAFVYHGSAAGLAATPSWTAESDQALSDFGISVATAGDMNGDGYSDVIIGAAAYDRNFDDEGRVYLFLGGDGGLATTPSWTAEGWADYAQFGFSVAAAGDVNLDGYSDFMTGFPFYDNGRGGAALFYGSADGQGQQVWTINADQPGAGLGYSVAGVGDFTGDGFADVIAGAPYYDHQTNTGAGMFFGYMGNGRRFDRPGPLLQQMRVDGAAPIAAGGSSDYQNAFALRARASSPAGRERVWLEWEVKPFGEAFDGDEIGSGRALDTGFASPANGSRIQLDETVLGLENGERYVWRARIASDSPFFPRSPWIWRQENALTELDFRTTGAVIGVGNAPAPKAPPFALEPIHPNPFQAQGEIAYVLAAASSVRLALYDVQGRMRVLIDEGAKTAGRHAVTWDGHAGGRALEAGVYFVRLAIGDRVESRKLTIAH